MTFRRTIDIERADGGWILTISAGHMQPPMSKKIFSSFDEVCKYVNLILSATQGEIQSAKCQPVRE